VLWEQLTLPRGSAGAALLFCPAYTAPVGRRGPLVVANHGIYERFPQEFSRARRLRAIPVYRAAVRRADAVIANSRSTSADLVEFLGADPARIEVVYAGPGPQFREPPGPEAVDAAVRRALGERAPYVMFAGKLSPRRNLPALIEAFAAARRADGLPHRLLVVGPQGDAAPIGEQAARLGVTDALVHLHHLELGELQLLYTGADVFALPTTYEGYSWTILEAMASGAPVLTADHPALHEEGVADAAEVVAEPTPAALEAALRRLLADPELRRRRSEAGRAVAARFSWERTAAETMAVLDRVAAPTDSR
jgi:glycosyltransferase involved in cell wall biosynthesis